MYRSRGTNAALLLWRRSSTTQTQRPTLTVSRFLTTSNDGDLTTNHNQAVGDPRLTEWIPPNRPLAGDKGYSHLYNTTDDDNDEDEKQNEQDELEDIERELQLLEDEADLSEDEQLKRIEEELNLLEAAEANNTKAKKRVVKQPPQTIDWMKTRREALDSTTLTPAFGRPQAQDSLTIQHHTLLTANEIMDFLTSLGGIDVNLIEDQVMNEHGDTRLGGAARGIIFVTGSSTAHIRMLATSLVEQLKLRKLQERGVIGARHGAEGVDDEDSTWVAVDCKNYIVNIQDAPTRKMMDLESWWSQADPLADYKLQGTDEWDEEAIDEFVAQNPVPPNYGRSMDTSTRGGWSDTLNQLQNKRWTAPHRAVVPKPRTGRRRKKQTKKRSRER